MIRSRNVLKSFESCVIVTSDRSRPFESWTDLFKFLQFHFCQNGLKFNANTRLWFYFLWTIWHTARDNIVESALVSRLIAGVLSYHSTNPHFWKSCFGKATYNLSDKQVQFSFDLIFELISQTFTSSVCHLLSNCSQVCFCLWLYSHIR